jgi:hypothetical protein
MPRFFFIPRKLSVTKNDSKDEGQDSCYGFYSTFLCLPRHWVASLGCASRLTF